MAAIVRIKRRLEDEPLEALILNCKRRKISNSKKDELAENSVSSSTLLTLAGTIKENENVLTHFKKQDLKEIKNNYKSHLVDLTNKMRKEQKQISKNNRFKIVNCLRSCNIETTDTNAVPDTDAPKSDITILDIEADVNESSCKDETNFDEKYVYDLYYTSSDYFGDADFEEEKGISIYPFKESLYFSPSDDIIDSDLDSEDSNAENNWRNDYPDEDDMLSVNEEDIVEAMNNIGLDDDLLSSDDGEEGFVYSIDSEAAGFEEDIDETDVHRYGERYARFKARHKTNSEDSSRDFDLYCGNSENEDDDDDNYTSTKYY